MKLTLKKKKKIDQKGHPLHPNHDFMECNNNFNRGKREEKIYIFEGRRNTEIFVISVN